MPGGKTVSVNGCRYGKLGNFLGGKVKFGGISAGGLTAEAAQNMTSRNLTMISFRILRIKQVLFSAIFQRICFAHILFEQQSNNYSCMSDFDCMLLCMYWPLHNPEFH